MILRPLVRKHTSAVIATLEALGLKVGDAKAPAGGPPYVVVYPIPGGRAAGTLGEPESDAELIYQVTCVATTRYQAEWLVDEAMGLLDGLIEVNDRSIPHVALESHSGVFRDDDQTAPIFTAAPRFRVFTTPGTDES